MSESSGWTSPGTSSGGPGQPGTPPGWSAQQPPAAPPSGWGQAGFAQPPGWGQAGWGQPRPPEVKPGVVPLRPLGVGEILDGAISCMRSYPRPMLGLSAIVAVAAQIIMVAAQWL